MKKMLLAAVLVILLSGAGAVGAYEPGYEMSLVSVTLRSDGLIAIIAENPSDSQELTQQYMAAVYPEEMIVRYNPDLDGTAVSIEGLISVDEWYRLQGEKREGSEFPRRYFVSGRRTTIWVQDWQEIRIWEEQIEIASEEFFKISHKEKRKVSPNFGKKSVRSKR